MILIVKYQLSVCFLQQWYALSDPAVEEAIYDRNSFQKFLDIDLLSHRVPDETTILNFRHLLEENKLQERFFATVNEQLEKKGLLMKEGTIVDATIIAAPSSTKNKGQKRDSKMSSTKKGNQWHFGMKAQQKAPKIHKKPARNGIKIQKSSKNYPKITTPA